MSQSEVSPKQPLKQACQTGWLDPDDEDDIRGKGNFVHREVKTAGRQTQSATQIQWENIWIEKNKKDMQIITKLLEGGHSRTGNVHADKWSLH